MKNDVRRPRFPGKSAPDGILKMPTAAKMPENRGRWTLKMPSIGRDIPQKLSTCRDIPQKPSTGRDGYRKNILTPRKALRCGHLLLSVTCRKRFLVQGLIQI